MIDLALHTHGIMPLKEYELRTYVEAILRDGYGEAAIIYQLQSFLENDDPVTYRVRCLFRDGNKEQMRYSQLRIRMSKDRKNWSRSEWRFFIFSKLEEALMIGSKVYVGHAPLEEVEPV